MVILMGFERDLANLVMYQQFATENGPVEIVDLPIKDVDVP